MYSTFPLYRETYAFFVKALVHKHYHLDTNFKTSAMNNNNESNGDAASSNPIIKADAKVRIVTPNKKGSKTEAAVKNYKNKNKSKKNGESVPKPKEEIALLSGDAINYNNM